MFNLSGEALTELAGLRLRRLHLQFPRFNEGDDLYDNPPLTSLPVFPRLETLTFDGSYLRDEDLRRLAAQPRVKSLRIEAQIIDADLAELQELEALEELTIAAPLKTKDIIELHTLRRLKALHIRDTNGDWPWELEVFERDFDFDTEEAEAASEAYRNALSRLRSVTPGIVIDEKTDVLEWSEQSAIPPEFESPWRGLQAPLAPWLRPSFWKPGQFDKYINEMNLPW